MCHGAAVQASVGSLAYAGADPYAGTGHLDFGIPQTRNRPLRVTGPLPDERGRLAELLHIVFLLQRPAAPHVLAAPADRPPHPIRPSRRPPAPSASSPSLATTRAPLTHLRSALRALPSPAPAPRAPPRRPSPAAPPASRASPRPPRPSRPPRSLAPPGLAARRSLTIIGVKAPRHPLRA